MATATIDKKTQRTKIAKFRKAAQNGLGEFFHERTRKTKTTEEHNVYTLALPGATPVVLDTTRGDVPWDSTSVRALVGVK